MKTNSGVFKLEENPLHLGLGATCVVLETFPGDMDWYARYGAQTVADGKEGRLVSIHSFSSPWELWEMHPEGEELVMCLEGVITLHQESAAGFDGRVAILNPGQAVINPAGVWHTADVKSHARALFITAGLGTQHRPR